MPRENLNDLLAFLAVARDRSFTKAAAKLGVSRSALSHTLRGLEARLGLRLLTRTTRSVSLTTAGERLQNAVGHRIEEIGAELEALSELREKPAGTIRITAHEHPLNTVLLPCLSKFLPQYPDINVEVTIDYGRTDIYTAMTMVRLRLMQRDTDGALAWAEVVKGLDKDGSYLLGLGQLFGSARLADRATSFLMAAAASGLPWARPITGLSNRWPSVRTASSSPQLQRGSTLVKSSPARPHRRISWRS